MNNRDIEVSAERERREKACRGCHQEADFVDITETLAVILMIDGTRKPVTINKTEYWCNPCAKLRGIK